MRKLIAGDEFRRTRLHDEKGNRIPVSELRRLPTRLWQHIVRVTIGRTPPLPWFRSNVIPVIEQLLEPDWQIVERGSGNSTRWFAERAVPFGRSNTMPSGMTG